MSTGLNSSALSYQGFADQKLNMNLKQCIKSNENLLCVWLNTRD